MEKRRKLNKEVFKLKDRGMLAEDLLKMLERGSLNDIKIKLSDGEIVANKDILMARSEYFATMFSNNKFIVGETGSVDISHCSKAAMKKIVKYLFSGEVTFDQMALAQLLELYYTSDMMLLARFKDRLHRFVQHYVYVNNVSGNDEDAATRFFPELVSGLKLAYQYNLTFIKKSIIVELNYGLKVILNNVTASDVFKTLPFNLIKDIFLYDDAIQYIVPALQKKRFIAFIVWLSGNEASVEQKTEIVESFNFDDFTAEELLTSVRDSGLYSAKKIDERVLELFKNKDQVLKEKEKELKIKDQELRYSKKRKRN